MLNYCVTFFSDSDCLTGLSLSECLYFLCRGSSHYANLLQHSEHSYETISQPGIESKLHLGGHKIVRPVKTIISVSLHAYS